jgi:hypothetical protein
MWDRHGRGELKPIPIERGPMPANATADHEAVADDIAKVIGLARAAGIGHPMPYTYRFCQERMGWEGEAGRQRAGAILRDLRRAGTFYVPGSLTGREVDGKRMPGSTAWAEPLAVEQVVSAGPAVPDGVEAGGDVGRYGEPVAERG